MAEKNNKNKRKFAAVLLGIVGVAGLSVASASTLTVDTDTEVALGTGTFEACDDTVKVDYEYDESSYAITKIAVTGIADACIGENLSLALDYDVDGDDATTADAGTLDLNVASIADNGATADDNVAEWTSFTPALTVSSDLGDAVVIIAGTAL
ncbi:hypothetical protein [Demequina sp. NBRC 110051]|uniref:hypothetical protein n=1 Tax=Demequina sp. NBRC 110051 TaxID=1570340 RepID=UPI000A00557E|nr:hypothetical protein [Demequina sp. NBRC 110051]